MSARGAGALLEALHAAGRGLPLWPACQCAAVLTAFAWFVGRARGPDAPLRPLLAASFAGAAVGAAALSVLLRVPAWLRAGGPASALLGGVVAYGALGGLAGSYAALARLRGRAMPEALDRLAPCLGALVVLGRAGCFFAGCDFGTISGAPWAVRFPAASPAFEEHLARGLVLATDHRSLPVHPTQLYEMILGVFVSAAPLLAERSRARPRPGTPFWMAAAVYSIGRLLLDGLRGDAAADAWGPWTPSQWIALAVLAAAAAHSLPPRLARRSPGAA